MEDNFNNADNPEVVESTVTRALNSKDIQSGYLSAIEAAAEKEQNPTYELPEYKSNPYGNMTDLYKTTESGERYLDIVNTFKPIEDNDQLSLIDTSTIPPEYKRYAELYNRKQSIGTKMVEINAIEDPIAKQLEYQKTLMEEFGYDILESYYGADVRNANYWYQQFRQGNYSNPLNNAVTLDEVLSRSEAMWRDLNYADYSTGPLSRTAQGIAQLSGQTLTPDMLEQLKPDLSAELGMDNDKILELLQAGILDNDKRLLTDEDGKAYGYLNEDGKVYSVYTEEEYKQVQPQEDAYVLRNGDLFLNNKSEFAVSMGSLGRGLVRSVFDIGQFIVAAGGAVLDLGEMFTGDFTFDQMANAYNGMETLANKTKFIGLDSRVEMDGKRGWGANMYDIAGFTGQIVGAIALGIATGGVSTVGSIGKVGLSELGQQVMKELGEQGIKEVSEQVIKEATERAMKELAQQGIKQFTEEGAELLAKELAGEFTTKVAKETLDEAAQKLMKEQFTDVLQSRIKKSIVKAGSYSDDAIKNAFSSNSKFIGRRLTKYGEGFMNNSLTAQGLRFTGRLGGKIHGTWMGNPTGSAGAKTLSQILRSRGSFAAIHASKDAMNVYSNIYLETGDANQAFDVSWKVFAMNTISSALISGAIDDSVTSDWRKVTNGFTKFDDKFMKKMATNTTTKYMMGKYVLADTLLDGVDNMFTMAVEQAGREGDVSLDSIMSTMGEMAQNPSTLAMLTLMGTFNANGSRKTYKNLAYTMPEISYKTMDAHINNKLSDVYNKAATPAERNDAALMTREWADIQRQSHEANPSEPLLAQANAVETFIKKFDAMGDRDGINPVWKGVIDEAVKEVKKNQSDSIYNTVKKTTDIIEKTKTNLVNDVLFTGFFNTMKARRAKSTGVARVYSEMSKGIAKALFDNGEASVYRPYLLSVLDAMDGKEVPQRDRGKLKFSKDSIQYVERLTLKPGNKRRTPNPDYDTDWHTYKIPSTEQNPEVKALVSALELFDAVTKNLGGDTNNGMFKLEKTAGNEWIFRFRNSGGNELDVIDKLYTTIHDIADLVDVKRGDQRLALDSLKENVLSLLSLKEKLTDTDAIELLVNEFKVMDIDHAMTLMSILGTSGTKDSDLFVLYEGHRAAKAFDSGNNLSYPQKLYLYDKIKSANTKALSNPDYENTKVGQAMLAAHKKLSSSLDVDKEGASSVETIIKTLVEEIIPSDIDNRDALVEGFVKLYEQNVIQYDTGVETFIRDVLDDTKFSNEVKGTLDQLLDQGVLRREAIQKIYDSRMQREAKIGELKTTRNDNLTYLQSDEFIVDILSDVSSELPLRIFFDGWRIESFEGNTIGFRGIPSGVDTKSGSELRQFIRQNFQDRINTVEEMETIMKLSGRFNDLVDRVLGPNFTKENATEQQLKLYDRIMRRAEKYLTKEEQTTYHNAKHFLKFSYDFINSMREDLRQIEFDQFREDVGIAIKEYYVDVESELFKAVKSGTRPNNEFYNMFEDDAHFKRVFSLSKNERFIRVDKELLNRVLYDKLGTAETKKQNMLNNLNKVIDFFENNTTEFELPKRIYTINYSKVPPKVVSDYHKFRTNSVLTRDDVNAIKVGAIEAGFFADYNQKNPTAYMTPTKFKQILDDYAAKLNSEKYTPVTRFDNLSDFEDAITALGYEPVEFRYGSHVPGIQVYRNSATVLSTPTGGEVTVRLDESPKLEVTTAETTKVMDNSVIEYMLDVLLDGHEYVDAETLITKAHLFTGDVDTSRKVTVESAIRSIETFMSKLGKLASQQDNVTQLFSMTQGNIHNVNRQEMHYNYLADIIKELGKDEASQLKSYIPLEIANRLEQDPTYPYKLDPEVEVVRIDGKPTYFRIAHSLDVDKATALLDSGSFDIRYIIPAYSGLVQIPKGEGIKPELEFSDEVMNLSNSSLLGFISTVESPLNAGERYDILDMLNNGVNDINVSKPVDEYSSITSARTAAQLNNKVLNQVIKLVQDKFDAIQDATGINLTPESRMILSDFRLREALLNPDTDINKAFNKVMRGVQVPTKGEFTTGIGMRNMIDVKEGSPTYMDGRLSSQYEKHYSYNRDTFEESFVAARQVVETLRTVPSTQVVKSYTPTPATDLRGVMLPVGDGQFAIPLQNIQYFTPEMLALLPKSVQDMIVKKQAELKEISSNVLPFEKQFIDRARFGDTRAPSIELGRTSISDTQHKKILENLKTREEYKERINNDPTKEFQLTDINPMQLNDIYSQVRFRDVKKNAQSSAQGSLIFINENNRYELSKSMYDLSKIYSAVEKIGVPVDKILDITNDIMTNSTGIKYQSIHNKYYAIDTTTGEIVNRYNYASGYQGDSDIGFLKVLDDYPTVESLENIKIVMLGKEDTESLDSFSLKEVKLTEEVGGRTVFNATRYDMEDYFLKTVMGRAEYEDVEGTYTKARNALINGVDDYSNRYHIAKAFNSLQDPLSIIRKTMKYTLTDLGVDSIKADSYVQRVMSKALGNIDGDSFYGNAYKEMFRRILNSIEHGEMSDEYEFSLKTHANISDREFVQALLDDVKFDDLDYRDRAEVRNINKELQSLATDTIGRIGVEHKDALDKFVFSYAELFHGERAGSNLFNVAPSKEVVDGMLGYLEANGINRAEAFRYITQSLFTKVSKLTPIFNFYAGDYSVDDLVYRANHGDSVLLKTKLQNSDLTISELVGKKIVLLDLEAGNNVNADSVIAQVALGKGTMDADHTFKYDDRDVVSYIVNRKGESIVQHSADIIAKLGTSYEQVLRKSDGSIPLGARDVLLSRQADLMPILDELRSQGYVIITKRGNQYDLPKLAQDIYGRSATDVFQDNPWMDIDSGILPIKKTASGDEKLENIEFSEATYAKYPTLRDITDKDAAHDAVNDIIKTAAAYTERVDLLRQESKATAGIGNVLRNLQETLGLESVPRTGLDSFRGRLNNTKVIDPDTLAQTMGRFTRLLNGYRDSVDRKKLYDKASSYLYSFTRGFYSEEGARGLVAGGGENFLRLLNVLKANDLGTIDYNKMSQQLFKIIKEDYIKTDSDFVTNQQVIDVLLNPKTYDDPEFYKTIQEITDSPLSVDIVKASELMLTADTTDTKSLRSNIILSKNYRRIGAKTLLEGSFLDPEAEAFLNSHLFSEILQRSGTSDANDEATYRIGNLGIDRALSELWRYGTNYPRRGGAKVEGLYGFLNDGQVFADNSLDVGTARLDAAAYKKLTGNDYEETLDANGNPLPEYYLVQRFPNDRNASYVPVKIEVVSGDNLSSFAMHPMTVKMLNGDFDGDKASLLKLGNNTPEEIELLSIVHDAIFNPMRNVADVLTRTQQLLETNPVKNYHGEALKFIMNKFDDLEDGEVPTRQEMEDIYLEFRESYIPEGDIDESNLRSIHEFYSEDINKLFNHIMAYDTGDVFKIVRDPEYTMGDTRLSMKGRDLSDAVKATILANNLLKLIKGPDSDSMTGSYQLNAHGGADRITTIKNMSDLPQRSLSYDDLSERQLYEAFLLYPDEVKTIVNDVFHTTDDIDNPYDILRKAEVWSARQQQYDGDLNKRYIETVSKLSGTTMIDSYAQINDVLNRLKDKFGSMINDEASLLNREHSDVNMPLHMQAALLSSIYDPKLFDPRKEYDFKDATEADLWTVALVPNELSANTAIVPTNSTKTLKSYDVVYATKPNSFRGVKLGEFSDNRITRDINANGIQKGTIEYISPDGKYIIISESIPMSKTSDAKIAAQSSFFKATLRPQDNYEATLADGSNLDLVINIKDIADLAKTGPEEIKQYMQIIGEQEVTINGEVMTVPIIRMNMAIVEYLHNIKNYNEDVSKGPLGETASGTTIDWLGYLTGRQSLLAPLFSNTTYNRAYDEISIEHPELVKKYIERQTKQTYYNRNIAFFGRAYRLLNIVNLMTDSEFASAFDTPVSKQQYGRDILTNIQSDKGLTQSHYYETQENALLNAVNVVTEANAFEALLNRVTDENENTLKDKKEYLTNLFSDEIGEALKVSKLPLGVSKPASELPAAFRKGSVEDRLVDTEISPRGYSRGTSQDSLRYQTGYGSMLDTNVPASWFFNKVSGNFKSTRELMDLARNRELGHITQDAEIGSYADRFEAIEPLFRSKGRIPVDLNRDGMKSEIVARSIPVRIADGLSPTKLDAYLNNGQPYDINNTRYKTPSTSSTSVGDNLRYLTKLVQNLRGEDGKVDMARAAEANSIFYRGLDNTPVEPKGIATISNRDYRVNERGEFVFDIKANQKEFNLRDAKKELVSKGAEFFRGVDDTADAEARVDAGYRTSRVLTEGEANRYAQEYPSLHIKPNEEIDLVDFEYKYETALFAWDNNIRELYRDAFMPPSDTDLEPGRVARVGSKYRTASTVGDGRNKHLEFSRNLLTYLGISAKGEDPKGIIRAAHHLVTNAQALGTKLNRKVFALRDAIGNNSGFKKYYLYKHLLNQLELGHDKAEIITRYKDSLPPEVQDISADDVFNDIAKYVRTYVTVADNNRAVTMYETHMKQIINMAQEVTNINPIELDLLMMYPAVMETGDLTIDPSIKGKATMLEKMTTLFDPTKYGKFGEKQAAQRIIDDPFEGIIVVGQSVADMLSIKNFNDVATKRGFAESKTPMKAAFDYIDKLQSRLGSHEKITWLGDLKNWVNENPLYNKFLKKALDEPGSTSISNIVKNLMLQKSEVEQKIRGLHTIEGTIDDRVLDSIRTQTQDSILKDAIDDYHQIESARLSIVASFLNKVTHYGDETLYQVLSRENDGVEITDGALRKVNPRRPRSQLFGRDIYTLKHEVFNKMQGAKGHEIAFLMDALAGNVFLTNRDLANTLEKKIYTAKRPEGFNKFLSVISSQFSKLVMGNPIRFMERAMGRFAFFDLAMLSGQNPKTILYMPRAAKEMRQRAATKGRVENFTLDKYYNYKGPDFMEVKDYDAIDRAKKGYSLPVIGKVNERVLEGIEWMSDMVRYANFLANIDDIDKGTFKYGNTYKYKEYMDSITDKYEKSYEALSHALPTPGDLPDLAKSLSPHFVFTSFGLGLARAGSDWVGSSYRAMDDIIRRGDTSGLRSTLLIPGATIAGISAMSLMMYYLIAEIYDIDDDERDEWIKKQATIDPFATVVFGNPVARPTWNPLTSIYNDWIEPFKAGYDGDIYTKEDDSILRGLVGGTILNQASKLNPIYKIIPESALGKDLFGANITDTKDQYNFYENLARKSVGAAIGNTAMNSLMKSMQLSDATDAPFLEDLIRGMGNAIADEFGNSRQYKQDIKDYYNARTIIYDHIYSDAGTPLTESDLDVWDYSSNYSNSMNEDRVAALKTDIRNAMRNKDSVSVISTLIYNAIQSGMPDNEIRYVLNQVTISGVLSKVDDMDKFLDTLTDKQYRIVNNALAYEARVFPTLARNQGHTNLNGGFQIPFGNGLNGVE